MSRWISTDPALEKYFPKPNDYDTEHDFYWYILNDASGKLPGMGGVYRSINIALYQYSGCSPINIIDPDGNEELVFLRDANQRYRRFESICLVYPDGTFDNENIAQLDRIKNLTVNDVISVLGFPINDFFTSGEYRDFSTLPDNQTKYGTIAEGLYDYQMGSFTTQRGNIMHGLRLSSEEWGGAVAQDPNVNGGINPRTGLPYLTGVWIHSAARPGIGGYDSSDYRARSEGCITSPNFMQLFNYLLTSPTGHSGKVYIRR